MYGGSMIAVYLAGTILLIISVIAGGCLLMGKIQGKTQPVVNQTEALRAQYEATLRSISGFPLSKASLKAPG